MSVELWKSIFDWATVVLIAFTVVSGAGALITGDIISKRQEAKLRQFDTDLTGAKTELGKQQERAANAEHDAAEAKATASTANERTLTLQKAAADAKTAQQRVEIDLAKQQERAANAEKAFLELKRQTEPRRVNAEQRQKFLATIRVPAGLRPSIRLTPQGGVPDAEDFARDLASLLQDAGFSVELNIGPFSIVGGSPRNIRLSAGSNRFNDRSALATALVEAGIVKPPIEVVDADGFPDFLALIIGARPN